MAIGKAVENEFGAQFNYHKLREVRIINDDNIGVQLTLTVYSWLDKKSRIEGKQPTIRQCIISNADFAVDPFYALLKAKFPDFAKGDDDMDNSFKALKADAAKAPVRNAAKVPVFTMQTAHGDLMKRWKEEPEAVVEDAEVTDVTEKAEETIQQHVERNLSVLTLNDEQQPEETKADAEEKPAEESKEEVKQEEKDDSITSTFKR